MNYEPVAIDRQPIGKTRRKTADAELDGIYETRNTLVNDIGHEDIIAAKEQGDIHKPSSKSTLFTLSPVKATLPFEDMIVRERIQFLICLAIVSFGGPLVFRYAIGSHHLQDNSSAITVVEWVLLFAMFFDLIHTIFRGLPMMSGRPTDIASSRTR
jgi:hypothetical protein